MAGEVIQHGWSDGNDNDVSGENGHSRNARLAIFAPRAMCSTWWAIDDDDVIPFSRHLPGFPVYVLMRVSHHFIRMPLSPARIAQYWALAWGWRQ